MFGDRKAEKGEMIRSQVVDLGNFHSTTPVEVFFLLSYQFQLNHLKAT